MIKKAKLPLQDMLTAIDSLSPLDIPSDMQLKKKLFSKGSLKLFKGEGLDRFATLTIKGLNLYHYDFGIAFPKASTPYPMFLYQVIIVPKRVLALTHYPFYRAKDEKAINHLADLLEEDKYHAEMLLSSSKQQEFLAGDIIPNSFNGFIRTTEIDDAYDSIKELFKQWHHGLINNSIEATEEEAKEASQWTEGFCKRFYEKDYGYRSTSRYLGERWTREVFERYIFNL
ncbi:hypothetical protein F8154_01185 [Alkaliphilus pronyensis]|uniref:15,16-dihydrobiliverdin:ferredoxin oxidoreductase n=1 Tax=Alkaliphilus pronyensis TaxID=1482732 RepID=A0A6I0FA84_9FIRM|nr:hypothetical protein [Alkaliphilus pronyensis]KAB3539075.1 hypothetical protein F8154_01185 [Alkaliphilus pronyensis]